ncbi:hypothetical protein AAFF_G00240660 [Aldrovandia affinis]|uniref:Uncharacterized protein n=1 Tax=Aldrovandia affinis TaxID=143900 RepID=A0AAD7SUS4_9TELE|nr:hypothetical protein AAFF_G00240660 [Aldrovandia affinis]
MVLDFSHCLDLKLQPEVTTYGGLPLSQAYLRHGVLSPFSTPYQLPVQFGLKILAQCSVLLGVAETVHAILKRQSMPLVEDDSEWKLLEDWEASFSFQRGGRGGLAGVLPEDSEPREPVRGGVPVRAAVGPEVAFRHGTPYIDRFLSVNTTRQMRRFS